MILEIALGIIVGVFLLFILPAVLEALGGVAVWALGLGLVFGVVYALWVFGVAFIESQDVRVETAWLSLLGLVVTLGIKINSDKALYYKPSLGLKRWLIWVRPTFKTTSKMKKIKLLRTLDQEQSEHREKVLEYARLNGWELAGVISNELRDSLSFYIKNHIVEVNHSADDEEDEPVITITSPSAIIKSRNRIAIIKVVVSPKTFNKALYSFNFVERVRPFGEYSFSRQRKLFKKSKKLVERYVADNPELLDGIRVEEVRRIEPKF